MTLKSFAPSSVPFLNELFYILRSLLHVNIGLRLNSFALPDVIGGYAISPTWLVPRHNQDRVEDSGITIPGEVPSTLRLEFERACLYF